MKICPSCGFENVDAAKFCERCGYSLQEVQSIEPEIIEEKKQVSEEPSSDSAEGTDTTNSVKNKTEEATTENTTSFQFCPNCGAPIESNMAFCGNCGKDLRATVNKPVDSKTARADAMNQQPLQRPVAQTAPRQPMSKKQKIGLGICGAVIALLVGAYVFGSHYYSYDSQIDRFEETFKSQDPAKIADSITSEDPNYKVTTAGMKRFVDYYKAADHKKEFASFLTAVKSDPDNLADFELKQEGKYFGLFDKYKMIIKPTYLNISTDQSGMKLALDGKQKATSTGSDYQTTWGPLTPGEYQVEGTLDTEKSQSTVDLVRFNNDEFDTESNLKINLHKISFKVTSNIDGADVVLDGEKVGTIQDGEAEILDKVWHQGLQVQVQKQTEGEPLKTDSQEIGENDFLSRDYDASDYSSELPLDFENVKDKEDIQYFLDSLYSSLSSYTDEDYPFGASQKSHLANYFVNGVNNTDEQDFEKFINDIRTSPNKSHVDGEAEVESVTMTGKDTYVAQYLIYYDTVYSDSRSDVNQTFRYKKATLHYAESEGDFQIDNLGGAENFETVDNGE